MSADDVFDAAVAIAREVTSDRYSTESRMLLALVNAKIVPYIGPGAPLQHQLIAASSEFAAPFLARIAQLTEDVAALETRVMRRDAKITELEGYAAKGRVDSATVINQATDIRNLNARIAELEAQLNVERSKPKHVEHAHKFARCGSDIGGTHLERCACGKVRPIDIGDKL
jgi:outer membrane murein-binding lipoprotein Lpp